MINYNIQPEQTSTSHKCFVLDGNRIYSAEGRASNRAVSHANLYNIYSPHYRTRKRRVQNESLRRAILTEQQELWRGLQLQAGPGAQSYMEMLLPPDGRNQLGGTYLGQGWQVPAVHMSQFTVRTSIQINLSSSNLSILTPMILPCLPVYPLILISTRA